MRVVMYGGAALVLFLFAVSLVAAIWYSVLLAILLAGAEYLILLALAIYWRRERKKRPTITLYAVAQEQETKQKWDNGER